MGRAFISQAVAWENYTPEIVGEVITKMLQKATADLGHMPAYVSAAITPPFLTHHGRGVDVAISYSDMPG